MKKFGLTFKEKGGKFYSNIIQQKDFTKKIPDIKKKNARFITATALKNSADEVFIYYHFEIEKKVFTFKTSVSKNAKSISNDFPSASWIEREIQEFYKINFSGQIKKPLLYSG